MNTSNNKLMRKTFLFTGLILASSAASLNADLLTTYNFENAGNRFEDSINALNATDLLNAGDQNNDNFGSLPNYYNDSWGGQHAGALATAGLTDTVSWTTAGLSGTELVSYESLSLYTGSQSGKFTPSLAYEIGAGSSVDAGTGTEYEFQTWNLQTFDFANFTTTEVVTWTLTFTKGIGDNDRMRFDDLTLNGGIVVPEPSTLAMLVLGGLLICLRRRMYR